MEREQKAKEPKEVALEMGFQLELWWISHRMP